MLIVILAEYTKLKEANIMMNKFYPLHQLCILHP